LVTDDEVSIREVLAEGLQSFGYEVVQASTAADAFEIVRRGEVDLVLSDIDMPGESGLSLLKRVKEQDPDVDMIMVTGVVDLEVAIGAIRQGAADYVSKPFNLEEVQIVVERTLEKRRLIEENREYQSTLEQKVEERTRELEESYESTLEAMITALDFRDNETMGHSRRVVEYAVIVAKTMGIGEPELSWIRRGAILHDVGKIGVPEAILNKPDRLTAAEMAVMKSHPEKGAEILASIRAMRDIVPGVLHHHERFDGMGYPRFLKGENIPLQARIIIIADTFDAMTSTRPYRNALPTQVAVDEIRRCTATQFDPRLADVFVELADRGVIKPIEGPVAPASREGSRP
jgi:putative nucleotidyltransferase with HDIG domain